MPLKKLPRLPAFWMLLPSPEIPCESMLPTAPAPVDWFDNGAYPTQSQGLQALIEKPTAAPIPGNWKDGGCLDHLPNDPWGHPYQFLNPGVHGEIDVYSDGAAGPSGDANTAAIGSWQPEVAAAEKDYIQQVTQPKADSDGAQ